VIVRWTLQSLFRARTRIVGSVLAVTAAFLLVTTFKAVWQGETEKLVSYIDNSKADVWVMQSHVSNMHMATSFISDGKRTQIADVDGVNETAGILYLNSFVRAGSQRWLCYIVGVDQGVAFGGPWSVTRGKRSPGPGEAIIPEVLAKITGLDIGGQIQIAGRKFTVAGLSAGTFSAANPITFVESKDLADLLSLSGYDSYVLVRSQPGIDPEALATRIRQRVDDVEALPTATFAQNDRVLAKQMGTEVIGLMTAICAALAILLVGFSLYIHTSRIRRDLAILKALGFRGRHIYGSVLLQSVVLSGLPKVWRH